MDIEAVYNAVRSALADLPAYADVKAVAKHPDIWIKQGASMPLLSLIFSDGSFDHESGDKLWSQTVTTRFNLEAHLVITSTSDNLTLEFLRQFADIKTAIETLTKSASFNALGRIYLADVQTAHADSGEWMWAVMKLVVGE